MKKKKDPPLRSAWCATNDEMRKHIAHVGLVEHEDHVVVTIRSMKRIVVRQIGVMEVDAGDIGLESS